MCLIELKRFCCRLPAPKLINAAYSSFTRLTVGKKRAVETTTSVVKQKLPQRPVDIRLATETGPDLPGYSVGATSTPARGVAPEAVIKAECPFPVEGVALSWTRVAPHSSAMFWYAY